MLFSEIQDFLTRYYLYLKVAHIVSFTAWMAGLFYLPRLFVYHTQVTRNSEAAKLFCVMERRLLRFIMNPAMISTYVLGLAISVIPGVIDWSAAWWHMKLTAVVVLSGFQVFLSVQVKRFAQSQTPFSERFYRVINEIPTVLLIVIVYAVIVRWS